MLKERTCEDLTIRQPTCRVQGVFYAAERRTKLATIAPPDALSVIVNPDLRGGIETVDVQVRALIEAQRLLLGLTRDQVLICTDMYGSTSGTYGANVSPY